jgi:hypothetical protein
VFIIADGWEKSKQNENLLIKVNFQTTLPVWNFPCFFFKKFTFFFKLFALMFENVCFLAIFGALVLNITSEFLINVKGSESILQYLLESYRINTFLLSLRVGLEFVEFKVKFSVDSVPVCKSKYLYWIRGNKFSNEIFLKTWRKHSNRMWCVHITCPSFQWRDSKIIESTHWLSE